MKNLFFGAHAHLQLMCDLISGGIAKTCGANVGSLVEMWIIDKSSVDPDTGITDDGNGTITAITTTSPAVFYGWVFTKNTASFTETNTPAGGADVYVQDVQIFIPKREVSKRNAILLASSGKDLLIITKDGNGKYNLLGEQNGMNLSENASATGANKTDANGYTIKFHGDEPAPAKFIEAAAVADVIE